MKETVATIAEQIKLVIVIYAIICVVQTFSLGTAAADLLIGTLLSFGMVLVAILLKNFVKRPNLPGFAWATLVAFVLTLPVSPVGNLLVERVGMLNFSITGLPLLAFAGISVGDQLGVLKKLSWRIVLISFVVMMSTYFGSALVSQLVMKISGVI